MPGLLTRSKSLRLLTGSRRAHRKEPLNSVPQADASQTDFDRFNSATPVSRTRGTLEAPVMPTRPSTSGAPGERPVHFHKKTLPAPSVYSEDRFLAFSSPTDSTAVLHTIQQPGEQDVIGIALGSPKAAPDWALTPLANSNNPVRDTQMNQYGNASSVTLGSTQEPTKPKISRWKSFFRKTSTPSSTSLAASREKQSFYQLAQQATSTRADSHHDTSPTSETTPKQDKRSPSASPPAWDPEIRSSRKISNADACLDPALNAQTRQRAATVGIVDRINPRHGIKRSSTTPLRPLESASPGLLDVDIPDTKMERYSVMFSGVLEPSNRSSLLERRQPNAEKVKPLNQLTVKVCEESFSLLSLELTIGQSESKETKKLQRRATSPTVSGPPSARLSLFPSPSISGPSPLVTPTFRSRARSSSTKSTMSQNFTPSDVTKKSPQSMTRKDSAQPYMKPERLEQTELAPSSKSSQSCHSLSRTSLLHYKSCADTQEPEWELLPVPPRRSVATRETSPPPPRNPKRRESHKQPRVDIASASTSHLPATLPQPLSPLEAPSPLENLEILLSPPIFADRFGAAETVNAQRKNSERRPKLQTATVGIARSISVSKAKSPVSIARSVSVSKPNSPVGIARSVSVSKPNGPIGIARSVSVSKANSPVGIARSVSVSRANSPRALNRGRNGEASPERLVERHALTPTLVEIGNRRSHRVQLVEA
jgi:hypothetical protein